MTAPEPPLPACTVIIAARDEQDGIAACLRGFREAQVAPLLQVIVVANGCADRTAQVARAAGAEVIETPHPGKARAIALAEEQSRGQARLYVDADIALPAAAVDQLVAALKARDGAAAVTVRRRVDATGSTGPVRAFYAIHTRLPVFERGLTGRGVIGLTARGRARFGRFPDVTGDDFFLDSLFAPEEVAVLDAAGSSVLAPRASADLLRRLVRVRRGNRQLRADGSVHGRAAPTAWLTDVVLPRPRLWPAAPVYVAFTVLAEIKSRRAAAGQQWERGR